MQVADDIFKVPVKPEVLHEVVRMQMARRRSGCASVKNRGDVRGSTRKLFRQKGTGRARRGDVKSPLLRGGGVVFGPKPKKYLIKTPKKVRRLALKMALSDKFDNNALIVMENFNLAATKTREFVNILNAFDAKNVLVLTGGDDEGQTLKRCARNIPGVTVLNADGLNVYDILKHHRLMIPADCIKGVEGRLLS